MKKKKILIVDDEADILEILKIRFERSGYDVVTTNDGDSALEKWKKEKPDALLLDIMMPHVDGLSVLKKIREEDKRLPIFILTAFSNEERMQIASKFNANGFILKTDDIQKEVEKITAAIQIYDKYREKK
jgi:DNA-binding response OmpR family regulator